MLISLSPQCGLKPLSYNRMFHLQYYCGFKFAGSIVIKTLIPILSLALAFAFPFYFSISLINRVL
jgi:hypothetical protein